MHVDPGGVVVEHGSRLPEQVPYLSGTPIIPVLGFAFFEYQVYWAIALWLAWLLIKLTELKRRRP